MRSGWLALVLAGLSGTAQAIVNVESLRAVDPPEGLSGKLSLSAGGESGTVHTSSINAGAGVVWRRQAVTNFLTFNYAYGESLGVKVTDRSFVHARHVRHVRERTDWELFAQRQHNRFLRLSSRELVGSGARLTLYDEPSQDSRAFLGVGAMYVQERLEERIGTTDGGTSGLWRGNVYLALNWRTDDRVRLSSTTYWQPALTDAGDFRLLEEAALRVRVHGNLDLVTSLNIRHNSHPPQGVERTEITYRTGFEYDF
ncbi:DUF481 domain-containing protein [Ectothiorhodospiraceae bacterium 2226]|nr:DUF481 domain-containing protein [Ectothiorhodospiraceae bacterium 2226]